MVTVTTSHALVQLVSERRSSASMLPIISALGTLATGFGLLGVGVAGALIARIQAQTAQTKLRMELYAQRKPIYEAAKAFIVAVTQNQGVHERPYFDFMKSTSEVRFLFSDDMLRYLAEVRELGFDVHSAAAAQESAPPGQNPERTAAVYQKRDALVRLTQELETLELKFAPYMQIEVPLRIAPPLRVRRKHP